MALNIFFPIELIPFDGCIHIRDGNHNTILVVGEPADGSIPTEKTRTNAHLIADAFNTANKTGLLPSELAEQNEKLLQVLKLIQFCMPGSTKLAPNPKNWRNQLEAIVKDIPLNVEAFESYFHTPQPRATLTRSEAELTRPDAVDAAHNGAQITHDELSTDWLTCENGVFFQNGNDGHKSTLSENWRWPETGWRIVHP